MALDYMRPCGHEKPQADSQLHGVCVFCYRDRLGAAHRELAAATEQIATLQEQVDLRDSAVEWLTKTVERTAAERNTAQRECVAMREAIEAIPTTLASELQALGHTYSAKRLEELGQAQAQHATPTADPGAEPRELAREQPCGCVMCMCEDPVCCHGCGAKQCHTDDCVLGTDRRVYRDPHHDTRKLEVARGALQNAIATLRLIREGVPVKFDHQERYGIIADLVECLAAIDGEVGEVEQDITKCPTCGGVADRGHDRCLPPAPYECSKCDPHDDREVGDAG